MSGAPVIAVDVGGTKIRAGLVAGHTVSRVHTAATPASEGARAVLDRVAGLITAIASAAARGGNPARAVGVGSAGVIAPGSGVVLSATDALPGWAGTRLADELTRRTDLAVRAVNDVHAHALGEAAAGAARGTRDCLLVAAGTGIGGGIIANGRPVTGRHAAAGHIGHLPTAAARGLPCPCGATGHLEAIASGPAVLAAYRRAGGAAAASTRDLAGTARGGDPVAVEAFARAGRALGRALGGLANVLSPEVIVLGGGLAGAGDLWWPHVREAFESEMIPAVRGVPLRTALLGQDAALVGAASLWKDTECSDTETKEIP